MKKKILITITNDNFVRNYIFSKAFLDIEKEFSCFYLVDKDLKIKFLKKNTFFYSLKRNEKRIFEKYCLTQTFLNHKLSKSIEFSIKRYFDIKIWWDEDNFFQNIFKFPIRAGSKIYRFFLFLFLSSFIGKFFFKNYEIKIKDNKKIFETLRKIKPSLVVIPTQGQDFGHFSTVKICNKMHIKSFSLIDNWDNLSSRVMVKPFSNFIGVWGNQSKIHASRIQGIKKNRINIVGTPRFESYKKVREKNPFNFKYILFCEGFGLTKDINEILKKLDEIFNDKIFKNLKIIYRPHPWRKDNNIENMKNYKNIILDPQLKKNYLKKKFDSSVQPDLNYYPKLILNAEFIISAPTTMVIECLLLNKKVIVLGHKSNTVFNHYNHVVKLNHYDGVKNLKNVQMCWDLNDLYYQCVDIFFGKKKIVPKNKLSLNHFIFQNKNTYSKNLLKIIKNLIK